MSITPESVQEMLHSADFGDRLKAVNQLRQLDPAIAFRLIQGVVADPNVRVRYAAVSQLATLGSQDLAMSLEVLRRGLLEDPEPDVQAAAADALAALQLTDAFEDLRSVYHKSSEWLVQFSIIAALGELGDRRGFDLLQEALQSGNELVKTAAIGSMGELGDERALPLLLPYISDPDWQVRHRVAQALSHFDHPDAKAAIETLSHDAMAPVAQEAQMSLDRSL